jgi:hypothetical protein
VLDVDEEPDEPLDAVEPDDDPFDDEEDDDAEDDSGVDDLAAGLLLDPFDPFELDRLSVR